MNETTVLDYNCYNYGHNFVKDYDGCINCGYPKHIDDVLKFYYDWDMSYDDSGRGY